MDYALWTNICKVTGICATAVGLASAIGVYWFGRYADQQKAQRLETVERANTALREHAETIQPGLRLLDSSRRQEADAVVTRFELGSRFPQPLAEYSVRVVFAEPYHDVRAFTDGQINTSGGIQPVKQAPNSTEYAMRARDLAPNCRLILEFRAATALEPVTLELAPTPRTLAPP